MRTLAIEHSNKEAGNKIVKIYNPTVQKNWQPSVEILAIERTEDYTRIDFLHKADPKYINGGWVTMYPNTFIRINVTGETLSMIKAENIPLTPIRHHYKSKKAMLAYSLYFPKISENVRSIDIIERELGHPGNWFNFYGVSLVSTLNRRIEVNNQ